MALRKLAVLTTASILFGASYMEHAGDNVFLTTGKCGRRHLKNTVSERIINGTEADSGDWPWMVGLYTRNDTFRCGGVLISDQFVLTAAHCFRNENTSFISVRMGSTNISNSTECSGETTGLQASEQIDEKEGNAAPNGPVVCVEVEQVCVPIQKNCGFFMEDIAILKLERPVNFTDHIQPICLPENCEEPSSIAPTYIAGWGLVYDAEIYEYSSYEDYEVSTSDGEEIWRSSTEETGNSTSGVSVSFFSTAPLTLRQRNVTLIDKTACQEQLNRTVADYIICSSEGSCRGDSGGPLVYENNGTWFLVGIYSGGDKDCYNSKGPGLHIKVSYYVSKLILAFMELGNKTEAKIKDMCATDEERIQCVEKLYASPNKSVKYDSRNY